MAILLLSARPCRVLLDPLNAGLVCCLCSIAVPSRRCHSAVIFWFHTRSGKNISAGRHQKNQRHLRLTVCTNFLEWWDSKLEITRPLQPSSHLMRALHYHDMQTGVYCGHTEAPGSSYVVPAILGDEIYWLCKEGELDRALNVLVRIQEQGALPSVNMYCSLLKVCAKKKALAQAKLVHADLAKHRLDSIRFLGEYMVSTLVKCGGLDDAIQLFHKMPNRTAFSWTALISGYASVGKSKEALRMYHFMRQEGLAPNKYTFIGLLQACGTLSDLKEGKRIHVEILKFQCETDVFVGTCLVDMYGKCGSVMDAQKVFDGLSHRNVVLWTAMLTSYAQHGQADKALQLYQQMREQGFSPNVRTYVSLLQACCMLAERDEDVIVDGQIIRVKSLVKGKAIHSDAWSKGYDSDVFVGSTLVSMYGKCGSTVDAQSVFDRVSMRNVVLWTVMLTAYVQQGQAEKALWAYEQMLEEGMSPDVWTFASVLQACGMLAEKERDAGGNGQIIKLKSLDVGKVMYAHIWMKGQSESIFVGSTLLSMYAKCGSMMDAQTLFDGSFQQNVVSWTALITAYVEQGNPLKAFHLYQQMQEEDVSPNDRTFVAAIQACTMLAGKEGAFVLDGLSTKLESLGKGKALHAEACRKGYDSDVFVCSTLISMYGKCGSIMHAQDVFDGLVRLGHRNVVAWNTMLSLYAQQGQADKALQLYEQMHQEGVSPNDRTFVSALQACGMLAEKGEHVGDERANKAKYLERGKAIHAAAERKGCGSDVFVCNTLICMYSRCGSLVHAQKVFDGLPLRNVVSWNTILLAYAEQGQAEEALELYELMKEECISADVRTFVTLLQACIMLVNENSTCVKVLEKGKAIHVEASRKGHDSNVFVGSTLISMYGKCGHLLDAQIVFEGLPERNVVSWNAMLAAYVVQGQSEKALQLYGQMQEQNVSPSVVTSLLILQACSDAGGLDICRQIHCNLVTSGNYLDPLLATTLIHAYGRCASMADAQNVFDALKQPDVISWNALIAGYAREGDCSESLQCYEQMQLAGTKPNEVTFLLIISLCSHAGLVDRGVQYFESMVSEFCLTPQIEHYVCMVDLLGRAGYFTILEQLFSTIPIEPNLSMWLCLLSACRKHGKVLLGKQAFDCAVSVHPRHPAPYVLMSNIYADAGLLEYSKRVTALEQKAGTWQKPPGQSWIQNDQEIHTFVVEDHKHPEKEVIYDMLGKVRLKLSSLHHVDESPVKVANECKTTDLDLLQASALSVGCAGSADMIMPARNCKT